MATTKKPTAKLSARDLYDAAVSEADHEVELSAQAVKRANARHEKALKSRSELSGRKPRKAVATRLFRVKDRFKGATSKSASSAVSKTKTIAAGIRFGLIVRLMISLLAAVIFAAVLTSFSSFKDHAQPIWVLSIAIATLAVIPAKKEE